jgi:hypothetical protein
MAPIPVQSADTQPAQIGQNQSKKVSLTQIMGICRPAMGSGFSSRGGREKEIEVSAVEGMD